MIDQNNESEQVSIGELIWAKLDGYPWWPSIIIEVKERKCNQPIQWTVGFLGEKKSYQYLTRQRIKKWHEISTNNKKDIKAKIKNSFMSAIAYGNYINSKDLTYDNHHLYIEYLDKKTVSPGEEGVIVFKDHLKSGKPLENNEEKISRGNQIKSLINNELSEISNEMEIIKTNMNTILSKLPPDLLMKQFSKVDFSDSSTLFESTSIDSKMALLNYIEFLCQMFKIPYEANQTLEVLIKQLNNSNK